MRLTVLKVLAIPGRYRSLVINYNIPIADTPSWSAAQIPEDRTEVGAVQSLAMTGFTCDEADDAYPYASSFLTELASDPWCSRASCCLGPFSLVILLLDLAHFHMYLHIRTTSTLQILTPREIR